MATARVTVGALFETIGTAATVATGALNSVSGVVAMANAFVSKAQQNQAEQYLLDADVRIERMIEEAAREQAEVRLNIAAFRNKSEQHALGYDQSYERFSNILRKTAAGGGEVRGFRQAAE